MKASTPALAALAIALIGAATLWLAATQGDQQVRFVEEVLADPAAHRSGTYTLMGIPQPAEVPATTAQGVALRANPAYANATQWTTAWSADGTAYYSLHRLELADGPSGPVWWHTNETRRTPADPELAFPPSRQALPVPDGTLYPFEAFRDGARVRLWAYMPHAPETPIQPKPSQLTGRLLGSLPDGTPLPDGAHVFLVEQYTAGCSSKFLPPELQGKYDDDGDPVVPGNATAS